MEVAKFPWPPLRENSVKGVMQLITWPVELKKKLPVAAQIRRLEI
jgi:hypothetical protein